MIFSFLGGTVIKNLPANAGDTGDMGSVPGLGRSPGGGNDNPFQYSYLKNAMGREAWQVTVHGLDSESVGSSSRATEPDE